MIIQGHLPHTLEFSDLHRNFKDLVLKLDLELEFEAHCSRSTSLIRSLGFPNLHSSNVAWLGLCLGCVLGVHLASFFRLAGNPFASFSYCAAQALAFRLPPGNRGMLKPPTKQAAKFRIVLFFCGASPNSNSGMMRAFLFLKFSCQKAFKNNPQDSLADPWVLCLSCGGAPAGKSRVLGRHGQVIWGFPPWCRRDFLRNPPGGAGKRTDEGRAFKKTPLATHLVFNFLQ